jgi:outer membrane protein OmpA-like peptidoglycan-associated protein
MKTKIIITITFFLFLAFHVKAKRSAHIHPPTKSAAKKRYAMNELVKNVQYDFSKASIRPGYDDRLDQLAELVIEKKYAVALRGHADSIGTYKGNWVLSQKRSDKVKDYLVKRGVPSNLIISTAFGSTEPIASNKTAAGRQQNRRVEIKLKETDL